MQIRPSSCCYWSVVLPLAGFGPGQSIVDAFVLDPIARGMRIPSVQSSLDFHNSARSSPGRYLGATNSESSDLDELDDTMGGGGSPTPASPKPLWDKALTKIGATTSALVAGTFFLVLAYKRDALMVSWRHSQCSATVKHTQCSAHCSALHCATILVIGLLSRLLGFARRKCTGFYAPSKPSKMPCEQELRHRASE